MRIQNKFIMIILSGNDEKCVPFIHQSYVEKTFEAAETSSFLHKIITHNETLEFRSRLMISKTVES